jgi:hypothetical protein
MAYALRARSNHENRDWVRVKKPVWSKGKGYGLVFKAICPNLLTKPASLPAAGRLTLTLIPETFIF